MTTKKIGKSGRSAKPEVTPPKVVRTGTVKKMAPKQVLLEDASKSRGKKGTLSKVNLVQAKARAVAFRAVREARAAEAAEDYTELVLDLTESMGEARIVSIAASLGVSHVTALRTVRRLKEEGYLDTDFHRPVELTEKGKKLAKAARKRHELITSFLLKLGASPADVAVDAEGMEHHLSGSTVRAIKRYLGQ